MEWTFDYEFQKRMESHMKASKFEKRAGHNVKAEQNLLANGCPVMLPISREQNRQHG
jgi:hypothetical protein